MMMKRRPMTESAGSIGGTASPAVNVTRLPWRGRVMATVRPVRAPAVPRRRHRPYLLAWRYDRGRCRWWRGWHGRAGAAPAGADRGAGDAGSALPAYAPRSCTVAGAD